jgi:hypothetical protein
MFESLEQKTEKRGLSVAGVLTISEIVVTDLKSVKTMLSAAHHIACYVTFSLGHIRRSTTVSNKQIEVHFKESFHFVVSNLDQDVVNIKVKSLTTLGYRKTLAEFEVRVKNVVSSMDQQIRITENIYQERNLATGHLSCILKYRPAASHNFHSTHTRLMISSSSTDQSK